MKIGIISDTHNRLTTITQVIGLLVKQGVDEIIHCGDWTKPETLTYIADLARKAHLPLHGVYGNRDDHIMLDNVNQLLGFPVETPTGYEILHVNRNGRHIVVYHGHHKPTLKKIVEDSHYDVVLTGHTHKPLITQLSDRLLINPGSTAFSIPRRKEPRSFAIYDSVEHTAKITYFDAYQAK